MKKLFIFLSVILFVFLTLISSFAKAGDPLCYASISGKVTDKKTVEPLVKAFVIAYKLDGRKLVARTDSSGVYLLDKLSVGRYELSAFAFGYFLEIYPETLEVESGDTLTGINFELSTMPTGSISGRVTDSITGDPIFHARIFVHNIEGCEKSLAFSDSAGYYFIDKLQAGLYRATAFARGYKPLKYHTSIEVVADSVSSGVDFLMNKHGQLREGKIFGRVKDQWTCLPIPFADVTAYSSDQGYVQTAVTDEDGKYVLEDLPIMPFKVLGTASGYISEYYKEALLEENALEVTPTSSQVDFKLFGTREGFLNIGGRITLDGNPLENATIYAIFKTDPYTSSEEISPLKTNDMCGYIAASAVSGSEGEYLLEKLLPGTYYLLVTSPYGTVNGPEVELKFKNVCGVDINIGNSDVKEDNSTLPKDISLSQNYPNPFNPTTTIPFRVESDQWSVTRPIHTTLVVYNLVGQKVRVLLDEKMMSGDYQAIWDGKDDNNQRVSSGIYFYRFKAGDNSETRKMIMLK